MKQKPKYIRLEDECEKNPEIRKIATVNTGISNLINLLTANQCPVRLKSIKAGIILDAEIADKTIEFFDLEAFPKAEYNKGTTEILTAAAKDRLCNYLPKEDIEKLYNFFTNLEFTTG